MKQQKPQERVNLPSGLAGSDLHGGPASPVFFSIPELEPGPPPPLPSCEPRASEWPPRVLAQTANRCSLF